MWGNLLDDYLEKVVRKASYGYFMTNFETHSSPYGGITTKNFLDRLKSFGKLDAVELNPANYLSYFDKKAGTRLIVFGADLSGNNSSKVYNSYFINIIEKTHNLLSHLINKYILT